MQTITDPAEARLDAARAARVEARRALRAAQARLATAERKGASALVLSRRAAELEAARRANLAAIAAHIAADEALTLADAR